MQMSPACSLPVVQAVLKCGNVGWIWVVPLCPYCGEEHWHSGGSFADDPARFVGPECAQTCARVDLGRQQDSAAMDADRMRYILQPQPLVNVELGANTCER